MSAPALQLLTVTWAGDRTHFSVLQDSLRQSSLKNLPHAIVVQSEDECLFQEMGLAPATLRPTSQILPETVERKRRRSRFWQRTFGRRATTLGGSLARSIGWPRWVRYTGWHTQQLCKLAFAASSEADTVVVLDSDLVITRHADPTDFLMPDQIVCHQQGKELSAVRGKVRKWHETAHRLFAQPFPTAGALDCYFDTPFILHAPTVRAMLAWLEERYARPWWQVLLDQPPRRWSEFACYKQYLRSFLPMDSVTWRDTSKTGYLFDASDPDRLMRKFDELVEKQHCHYVTIHSQSSGRRKWKAEDYADRIRARLQVSG